MLGEQGHDRFVGAVRESFRRQAEHVLGDRSGVTPCPRCGDPIISVEVPATYARDGGMDVCRGCRAERDLYAIAFPEADLGGEGGG